MALEGQLTKNNNKKKDYCDMDLEYHSDAENTSPPKRSLDVTQEVPQMLVKQETGEGLETKKEEEEEEEKEEMQSLRKREKNIQENKAMLAKLLSELTPLNLPPLKRKQTRRGNVTFRKPRFKPEIVVIRKNPPRKCRPVNFSIEEQSVSPGLGEARDWMTDAKKLAGTDGEYVERSKESYVAKRPSVVRSVEDITKEDLDNIAYCRQDKTWARNGSYCHQCRQKTLDTKTSCRSGICEGLRGQVCGACLKRRYGEDAKAALLDPTWSCPKCRGMCNCSLCRRKEGRRPTGVLLDLAGHGSAHAYLQWIQEEQTRAL